jgi:AraC-like DNA-binding protein
MGTSSPPRRWIDRNAVRDPRAKPTLGLRATPPPLRTPEALAPLVATDDPAEFLAAPIGRCVVAPNFAIWCASPDLQGTIVWGTLDEACVRQMMAIGGFIHRPEIAARRRVLVDCRDLERIDADVLLGFTALARERVPAWQGGLERQAIIVPAGLIGILVAGAMPSIGVGHPLRFAQDVDDALAFVDHAGARTAHAQATELAEGVRGRSALLYRLRAEIGRALADTTVDRCAAALAMSTRTLQRELERLETSFSDELRRVRIAAAETLLVHTGVKIDAIASQVGFGTASRMSAVLRRELDLTAGELRARARA